MYLLIEKTSNPNWEIANQIAKLFLFVSKFSANCCEFHGSEKLSFVKNRKLIINGWTQNKLLFFPVA
jgi:hypothetical protein